MWPARKSRLTISLLPILLFLSVQAAGQIATPPHEGGMGYPGRPFASNVIVPQTRSFSTAGPGGIQIQQVDANVSIVEQVATTSLDVSLRNPTGSRLEAELLLPVPEGAVLRGFAFQGSATEPTAEILPKNEARRIYESIVAKIRDPALLEFIGYNLIRSSVFPVEANGTQKVRITYENLLPADGDRIDYVLPRSESLEYTVPWKVAVRIRAKRPISTVYSPSHEVTTERPTENSATVAMAESSAGEPGPFRLSYLIEHNGVTASLMAYPDPKVGGGYFLLLAGLPAKRPDANEQPAIKREVTLVFDRSGSMNGEKIEQVREAAYQILAGIEEGEAFNLFVYNEAVDAFSEGSVQKTPESTQRARDYLKNVNPRGGTNIHDALVEALRQPPREGTLPLVLFLTDGLPTIGQTSERAIRDAALKGNPYNRRVFTFGVGLDVNTPLLNSIASETRATPTFVLPGEDVEAKVAQVFRRLAGPVLTRPELKTGSGRTQEILPLRLPDLFEGDQLIVLGKYLGEDPLSFTLTGNYLGKERTFKFQFGLDKATTKNAYVPRLWANRKIAELIEGIRKLGGNGSPSVAVASAVRDPRIKELVDEVVLLSTEFGILTEYTAFLAREGTDLSDWRGNFDLAGSNFAVRNPIRSGMGAMFQEENIIRMKGQTFANPVATNRFLDSRMNSVTVSGVQQMNDLAFYRNQGQWVDSRLANKGVPMAPTKEIEFGSEDFQKLLRRLVQENRNGSLALKGDILMQVDGETVLVKGMQ